MQVVDLEIAPPSISDLRADAERLIMALRDKGLDDICVQLPVLASISGLLRENKWNVRVVVRENEVIAILRVFDPAEVSR